MTDILLDSNNDIKIQKGQFILIDSIEVLTRQRLLNKLRTFTGTLFTNINYGLNADLFFAKGTQEMLDQHLKTMIGDTIGVISLISFNSVIRDRIYYTDFTYKIETGEITGIRNLSLLGIGGVPSVTRGIWRDGYWDYEGTWDNEEIWGSD